MSKFGNLFVKTGEESKLVPNIKTINLKASHIKGETMTINQNIDVSNANIRGNVNIEGTLNVKGHISSGSSDDKFLGAIGKNWDAQLTPINNNWQSVCWSSKLNLFVAVSSSGDNDRIMTSHNGLDWIVRVSPAYNKWYSICWSPELELFLAVASSGIGNRVMTSSDGINWILRKTGITLYHCYNGSGNIINCSDTTKLTIGMSIGVVMGNGNVLESTIITSIINSTSFTTNNIITNLNNTILNADNNWNSICWSSELELFVAVASSGRGNCVMTSNNGIDWIYRNSPNNFGGNPSKLTSIVWSSKLNLFVAITSGNYFITSNNGIDWIEKQVYYQDWISITWSNELSLFVVVSSTIISNKILYSNDGNIWNEKLTFGEGLGQCFSSIIWIKEIGLFVSVNQSTNGYRIATSHNGLIWTNRVTPYIIGDNNWTSITWSPELLRLVAVSDTGEITRIITSG
jgi:hypothetical protein